MLPWLHCSCIIDHQPLEFPRKLSLNLGNNLVPSSVFFDHPQGVTVNIAGEEGEGAATVVTAEAEEEATVAEEVRDK